MDNLTFWTFVIGVATAVNAIVAFYMWRANMASISLSREIFEASHRPFIGVESIVLVLPSPELLVLTLQMKNYGDVPAKELRGTWDVKQSGVSMQMSSVPGGNTILFPSSSHYFTATFANPIIIAGILSEVIPLEVFFNASYQGVNEKKYSTAYQARYNKQSNLFTVTGGNWQ